MRDAAASRARTDALRSALYAPRTFDAVTRCAARTLDRRALLGLVPGSLLAGALQPVAAGLGGGSDYKGDGGGNGGNKGGDGGDGKDEKKDKKICK